MHIQEYVNLKKYAHFINLDISQKYSKLDLVCKFFLKYPISSTPTWYEKKKKKKTWYKDQLVYAKFDTRPLKVMLFEGRVWSHWVRPSSQVLEQCKKPFMRSALLWH
jgi:hypothetical protein